MVLVTGKGGPHRRPAHRAARAGAGTFLPAGLWRAPLGGFCEAHCDCDIRLVLGHRTWVPVLMRLCGALCALSVWAHGGTVHICRW